MSTRKSVSRSSAIKGLGKTGLTAAAPSPAAGADDSGAAPRRAGSTDAREQIRKRVFESPMIDTHEHLIEESDRLQGSAHLFVPCDDWALLLSHYLNSDFLSAGMPQADMDRFISPQMDPLDKWHLIAPYWPAVKSTGYAQAVRISIQELYGVKELSADNIPALQAAYEKTRAPGFYQRILKERAGIESCQVNNIGLTADPFRKSELPFLLLQDLSIVGMFAGPEIDKYAPPSGIKVKGLGDWHRVIHWWFDQYAPYAVAVKSPHAYFRDIDYARVPAEKAEPVFKNILERQPVSADEQKLLEDHLFWVAVDQATVHGLPVKLHTGYYAGANSMPLSRLRLNASSAAELCRLGPDAKFVFMHLCYPYYEELLAVVKQWSNAYVDMCWSWIINPVAAKDFLKKHIVTAPANKLFPFGGDYIHVEPVLGHSIMARRGMALALAELVDEGWLGLGDALDLVDPVLHENARHFFQIDRKSEAIKKAPWRIPSLCEL